MSNLQFVWKATFKDASEMDQFVNEQENLFQLVKDRFSELKFFTIKHMTKPIEVTVDLSIGLIYLNGFKEVDEDLIKKKDNIRLIFFRRHKHDLSSRLEELTHVITYFIGYQYQDSEGRNHKVILKLDSDGNMLVGD